MNYELRLPQFAGPLEKLLELIEEQKLPINEISLASVTDDFLRYLEQLRADESGDKGDSDGERARERIRVLADFVVVASRLVFIKSRSLLPSLPLDEETAADIRDLEHRLRVFQELRPALRTIAARWKDRRPAYDRPYFLNVASGGNALFYPGTLDRAEPLVTALERLFDSFQRFIREEQTVEAAMITLEEKIRDVLDKMGDLTEAPFSRITEAAAGRGEIIVTFLALLHLAREQLVILEQREHLSDIIIRKHQ